MPLVTTEQVASKIGDYLAKNRLDTEVFTDFPSDENVVSEGLYVARLYQSDRVVVEGTIAGPKSLYKITDTIEMYLVYGQQNSTVDKYLNLFAEIIDDEMFKVYSPREYAVEQVFENNSERYRIIFSLTRHQLT